MAEKADGNPMGRSRADKGMRGCFLTKDGCSEGPGRGREFNEVTHLQGGSCKGVGGPLPAKIGCSGGGKDPGTGVKEALGIQRWGSSFWGESLQLGEGLAEPGK